MSRGELATLLIDRAPGEVRAVALDRDRRPWHLFLERWNGQGQPAYFGQRLGARLRAVDGQTGNAFVELETGEEALLRLPKAARIHEGQALQVVVASEARRDKLARVALQAAGAVGPATAYETWLASLPFAAVPQALSDRASVDAAFEDALPAEVTLVKGGRLHITRTRALTAIDVDSAGRTGKGSAGARAVAIGRDAAREAARQALLRRLGGLIVMDCPGPLNRDGGRKVYAALAEALAEMSTLLVQLDGPSRLGLLQAALAWRFRPLEDVIFDESGRHSPESVLIRLMREAQNEARARPVVRLRISVGGDVCRAYLRHKSMCDAAFQAEFMGRVVIQPSPEQPSEVHVE